MSTETLLNPTEYGKTYLKKPDLGFGGGGGALSIRGGAKSAGESEEHIE